jgi:site-specific recombinase XerD
MLVSKTKSLPPAAEEFLKKLALKWSPNTMKFSRHAIRHFHRFMIQKKLQIHQLKLEDMTNFDEDLQQHDISFLSRKTIFHNVRNYIRSLEEGELVPPGLIPKLFPNYNPEYNRYAAMKLPALAEQFLTVLRTTHKPNTVNSYASTLRAFYKVHFGKNLPAYQIDRSHLESFFVDIYERKMANNHRIGRILYLRRYLDWLYDHGKIQIHPDELIKKEDFPKMEQKLPRPFPPDVDVEIQRRLAISDDICYQGLLLLRRTGLRGGELCDMTFDCLEEDLNGNHFLKVPMGKMNSERVLPLDPATVEVIEKIKRLHHNQPDPRTGKTYLLPNKYGEKRPRSYLTLRFQEATLGMAIPGKINMHRLRHSYATSLLSAGLPITTLKKLLGHKDIRMTLNYAAVTQETIRTEYFNALSKVSAQYKIASYPLNQPDLRRGATQSINEAVNYFKKHVKENGTSNQKKVDRLIYRLKILRHEISVFLNN